MANMSNKRLMLFLSIFLWKSNCWAEDGFRICFQETEGSSQCQGPSLTCSGWSSNPAWTQSFRDDTDDRGGGCNYQWKIEAHQNIQPNQQYRLCFQETEGSSQCQGTRSSCTGWSQSPSWTKYFRDDTDQRSGGCRYAWKIESKPAPSYNISSCRVCFKETEGSSQCQGNRGSCSGWSAKENPEWTLPFRDDTDNRGGGCAYYWYLDCQYSNCWAEDGFRICFQETERSSQCQGPSHTCSGWSSNPAWTQSFRDDTDDRGGGCNYQWKIEAHQNIQPNQQYRLCFQETEGSSQCQGTRSSCTGWSQSPSWTKYFRDDTDQRSGGCRYAWKIESKPAPSYNISSCRVCFKETEGSSQCQGNRESCSGWSAKENPEWTLPFRDDTDNRGGGCAYYWYLDCQYSKCGVSTIDTAHNKTNESQQNAKLSRTLFIVIATSLLFWISGIAVNSIHFHQ